MNAFDCCLVPPRVYPSPPDGNYVVRSGSTVELVCNAEGSPPPAITWSRRHGNDGRLPVSREFPIPSFIEVFRLSLGSSHGLWAATAASYCPSRPGELPKQNMMKPHE